MAEAGGPAQRVRRGEGQRPHLLPDAAGGADAGSAAAVVAFSVVADEAFERRVWATAAEPLTPQ